MTVDTYLLALVYLKIEIAKGVALTILKAEGEIFNKLVAGDIMRINFFSYYNRLICIFPYTNLFCIIWFEFPKKKCNKILVYIFGFKPLLFSFF